MRLSFAKESHALVLSSWKGVDTIGRLYVLLERNLVAETSCWSDLMERRRIARVKLELHFFKLRFLSIVALILTKKNDKFARLKQIFLSKASFADPSATEAGALIFFQ